MIGNYIENEPHAVLVQSMDEGLEFLPRAQTGIQPSKIADVVAVRAVRAGGKQRRRVAVSDPKGMQVGDEAFRIGETELRIELQPVSGARKPPRFLGHRFRS